MPKFLINKWINVFYFTFLKLYYVGVWKYTSTFRCHKNNLKVFFSGKMSVSKRDWKILKMPNKTVFKSLLKNILPTEMGWLNLMFCIWLKITEIKY